MLACRRVQKWPEFCPILRDMHEKVGNLTPILHWLLGFNKLSFDRWKLDWWENIFRVRASAATNLYGSRIVEWQVTQQDMENKGTIKISVESF